MVQTNESKIKDWAKGDFKAHRRKVRRLKFTMWFLAYFWLWFQFIQVFCLGWNVDGTRLATGSQDQTIRIWKTDDHLSVRQQLIFGIPQLYTHPGAFWWLQMRQEAELRGHTDAVVYMRWHPSHADKLASTASQEKSVRFWDQRVAKNTATVATPGHNLYLAWTHDGNYIAVGNKDDSE